MSEVVVTITVYSDHEGKVEIEERLLCTIVVGANVQAVADKAVAKVVGAINAA